MQKLATSQFVLLIAQIESVFCWYSYVDIVPASQRKT